MAGQAEEGLGTDFDARTAVGRIVDGVATSRRAREESWSDTVELARGIVADELLEGRAYRGWCYIAQTALSDEERRKPFVQQFDQHRIIECRNLRIEWMRERCPLP